MQTILRANVVDIPDICPGCGLAADNPEEMLAHWMRVGAFREGKDGILKFMPERPHDGDETTPTSRVRVPASRVLSPPTPEPVIVLVETEAPLPLALRVFSMALVFLGVGVLVIGSAVAGFLFVPVVIHPIVTYGPLAPGMKILSWLWHHGEITLPLVGLLSAMLAIPRARRKAWDLATTGIAYGGMAAVTVTAGATVAYLVWGIVRARGA